jgi:hypothetical protein
MKKEEELFVDKVEVSMQKYFDTRREVWSETGQDRIDLLLILKEDKNVCFGLECKRFDKKRGEEIGEYVKQAIRYTKADFEVSNKEYRRIPIAICPALSYNYLLLNEIEKEIDGYIWHQDRHTQFMEHHTINGFLGAFGIGELRKGKQDGKEFPFLSFSNKPIWSAEQKKIWDEVGKRYTGTRTQGLHPKFYPALLEKIKSL